MGLIIGRDTDEGIEYKGAAELNLFGCNLGNKASELCQQWQSLKFAMIMNACFVDINRSIYDICQQAQV